MIEWKVDTLANTMVAETPLCNYKITYLKDKVQLEFDDMFKEFDHDKDARDYAEKYHVDTLIRFGYRTALYQLSNQLGSSNFLKEDSGRDEIRLIDNMIELINYLIDEPELDSYYPELFD